jgi:hypothetical protein
MRTLTLALFVAFGMSATPLALGVAQTPPDSTPKVKKPPSTLGKILKKVADSAATVGAGAGVQSLLGSKAGGVAAALGATGVTPCGTGSVTSAGAALVGAAKGIVKSAVDTGTPGAVPCPQAGGIPGLPGGIPGLPAGIPGMPGGIPGLPAGIPGMPGGIPGVPNVAGAGAAVAGAALGGALGGGGASPLGGMGSLGAMAGLTPVGLAASAAPGAIKGVKGMLGGKPQDKLAMVRELGKGSLELKSVKFIEGTQEFEPGFEASFVAFAEAIALVEGTYYMHVSPELPRQKGAAPDTVLSRKRVEKIWGLMVASGVSDQKVFPVTELPAEMSADRKLPKAGEVKVEILKFEKQP